MPDLTHNSLKGRTDLDTPNCTDLHIIAYGSSRDDAWVIVIAAQ